MDTPPPSPTPNTPPPRRGWFARNWMWFLPTGCLTILGLFAAFILALVVFIFGALRSTDVYKTAVSRAKNSPEVVQALGTPIDEGWFIQGKTNAEGSSGTADMSVPLTGPKARGTLYFAAEKSAGKWIYKTLEVEVAGRPERIKLLDSDEADTEPETEPDPGS